MDTISFCYVVIQVSRFWVQGTCGIRVYTIVIQLLYIFLGHVKLTFWVVCLQSNCGNFWVGNLIIIAVYPQLVGVWSLTINQTNQPKFRAQVLRRLRILKKNFVSWWNLRMRCPEKDCLNELFLDFAICFCFCEKWKCRHVIWLGFWESLRSFFCLLALHWHCNKWDWRFLKVHISSFLVVGDLFSDSAIIFLGNLLQFLTDPFSWQTFSKLPFSLQVQLAEKEKKVPGCSLKVWHSFVFVSGGYVFVPQNWPFHFRKQPCLTTNWAPIDQAEESSIAPDIPEVVKKPLTQVWMGRNIGPTIFLCFQWICIVVCTSSKSSW